MKLELTLANWEGRQPVDAPIQELVIAGWTGRDQAAMEAHIRELEELGVARPDRTPIYYRCAASLLTTDDAIEVVGNTSSGEVEFVLLSTEHGLLVGVGSDHTDREVEKTGVTISKQLCPKPISKEIWKFDEVAGHWDELILRSFAISEGVRDLYQQGPVTAMQDPMGLLSGYSGRPELRRGSAMFCGTLAVKGNIRPAEKFEIELQDPVLGRCLRHEYDVVTLTIEG